MRIASEFMTRNMLYGFADIIHGTAMMMLMCGLLGREEAATKAKKAGDNAALCDTSVRDTCCVVVLH